MPKLEIQFHKSMNIDKRNTSFAYLRKGLTDVGTAGLYPAIDFVEVTTSLLDNDAILGIAGSESGGPTNPGPFILVQRGSDLLFFKMDGTQTGHSPLPITDFSIQAFTNGSDGVYVVNEDEVYRPNYNANSVTNVGTFPELPFIEIATFDGLYYWYLGQQIWRHLPDNDPELVMAETPFTGDILFAIPYKEYIAIFVRDETDTGSGNHEDSVVYFFDKANATFFVSRLNMRNVAIIGAANINGVLTCVYSESTLGNAHEQRGRMVVSQWNGETFQEINSIKTGRFNMTPSINFKGANCDANNSYMTFVVNGNTATTGDQDLYQNYLYKVDLEGKIEVLAETTADRMSGVYLGNEFISYHVRSIGTTPPLLYTQEMSYEPTVGDYTNFTDTEYITNFYCNAYNDHKLDGVSVSFEKLFGDEELDVYYRTSDREDFILLGQASYDLVVDNVNKRVDMTGDVPLPAQRYQFAKMPNGDSLPEFNEIQFKFVSRNGFSVIGAWFDYHYTSRNTFGVQ